MTLTQDILNIVVGLAASGGVGAVLWLAARNTRTAEGDNFWSKDSVATAVSLLLVSGLVIAQAWTLRGTMDLIPEPLTGALAGLVASSLCVFGVMRLLGRLPRN